MKAIHSFIYLEKKTSNYVLSVPIYHNSQGFLTSDTIDIFGQVFCPVQWRIFSNIPGL